MTTEVYPHQEQVRANRWRLLLDATVASVAGGLVVLADGPRVNPRPSLPLDGAKEDEIVQQAIRLGEKAANALYPPARKEAPPAPGAETRKLVPDDDKLLMAYRTWLAKGPTLAAVNDSIKDAAGFSPLLKQALMILFKGYAEPLGWTWHPVNKCFMA